MAQPVLRSLALLVCAAAAGVHQDVSHFRKVQKVTHRLNESQHGFSGGGGGWSDGHSGGANGSSGASSNLALGSGSGDEVDAADDYVGEAYDPEYDPGKSALSGMPSSAGSRPQHFTAAAAAAGMAAEADGGELVPGGGPSAGGDEWKDPDLGDVNLDAHLGKIVPKYHVFQEIFHITVCSFWLFMVASIPLAVAIMDGEITHAHVMQAIVLFVLVVVGLLMCVSVTQFKSIHWEGARHLTIVETVYVMSQILTTVGYGDITPAHEEGQILVGVFVMVAVVLFADIIHQMGRFGARQLDASRQLVVSQELSQRLAFWQRRARPRSPCRRQARGDTGSAGPCSDDNKSRARSIFVAAIGLHKDGAVGPRSLDPYVKVARACLIYIFLILGGAFFWQHFPGEGKTYFQGLYMSVITLTSTGLGDLVPETEGGQVFVAFWSVFGVAALINGCAALTEVMAISRRAMSRATQRSPKAEMRSFREACRGVGCTDPGGSLDRLQFLQFSLLQAGLCAPEDLRRIDAAFQQLAESDNAPGPGGSEPTGVRLEDLRPPGFELAATQPAR